MKSTGPLQRRVLSRRKCRPLKATDVTVGVAMTATVALLLDAGRQT
jgi:hypothetical protein